MKQEDLMVDDWVNLNFDIDYKTGESIYVPVQVTGINKDGTVDVNFTYDKSESMQDGWDLKLIKPIPITPEILEKNGFKKNEKGLYRISGNIVLNIHSYRLDMYNYDSEYLPYIKICDIKHVHNFQHLLKDFEIEKEIIL